MGIEDNKTVVLAWLKAFETEPAYHLLCDEVSWWAPGMGRIGLDQFKLQMSNIYKVLKTPVYLTIDHVTAEGDRVAVEAESFATHVSGKPYNNKYHFLMRFRDGKLLEFKEYMDTEMVTDVLCGGQRPLTG